jgi:hypothetical protein
VSEVPAKAQILRLKEVAKGTAEKPPTVAPDPKFTPITVQFNPTSLKIDRNNDTSGGATTRAQRRNQPNEGHATLTLDLEYDTAEGGPDGQPLDVRTRTQELRQFAEPPADDPKKAPPRMRFLWGKFSFDGIVTRIGEEIDYFDADGRALRAKVSLTITGQDPALEANAKGSAARTDDSGGGGTGPGSTPAKNPDTALDAQDGETVQQAMSRAGLDPAAWRSAMTGLTSPLGLSAGAQLQLDASASVGAGLGVTAGFSAGISAGVSAGVSAGLSVAASAGIAAGVTAGISVDASAGVSAGFSAEAGAAAGLVVGADAFAGAGAGLGAGGTVGASAQASAGFALAAAGGVEAATRGVLAAQAEAGAAAARASFAVPGPGPASSLGSSVASASASASASGGAGVSATASARAEVDARAVTFGRGVPLKPRPR